MDLGTLPEGEFSYAEGINNRGQIVGVSENGQIDPATGNPRFLAVLWEHGKIRDLGTLGGMSSFADTVNDRGQIMGVSLNAVPDPFSIVGLCSVTTLTQTRGFLWEHGEMRDLGSLGGPDTFPIFLNQRGQIAGMSSTSFNPDSNVCNSPIPSMDPFLWQNGKIKDLGNFGGTNPFFSGFVSGLNNRGQVVGVMTLPGDQITHAFLWDGEKLSDLNNLGGGIGGNFSSANGLNEAGDVIGWASPPGDQVIHAVLWRNGAETDLGTVDGDPCSVAENINSIGQIVGASHDAECNQFRHAFLWENGGPSVDLNSLIPANSLLQLTAAAFISDRGEIVGGGNPLGCTNDDACNHVFVLIPCDENHPDVEGCDYSFAHTTATASERPATATSETKLSPVEIMTRLRSAMANRYRRFGISPRQ
jgi:probable HAF family extracellular repeat protein